MEGRLSHERSGKPRRPLYPAAYGISRLYPGAPDPIPALTLPNPDLFVFMYVRELLNYIEAMRYGLRRLDELPVSVRLIRETHEHPPRAVSEDGG